jgi:hypothetical protein
MTKEEIKLPTEEYTYEFHGTEFSIKPVSQETRELLENALDEGAEIRLMPEEMPTSIFITFKAESMPVRVCSHSVVGVKLKLHLHLLGHYRDFESRLKDFLQDVEDYKDNFANMPKKGELSHIKYVNVINEYKY